jgi:hypothetical protein
MSYPKHDLLMCDIALLREQAVSQKEQHKKRRIIGNHKTVGYGKRPQQQLLPD